MVDGVALSLTVQASKRKSIVQRAIDAWHSTNSYT